MPVRNVLVCHTLIVQALEQLKAECCAKGVDDRGLLLMMIEYRSNAQLLKSYTGLMLRAVNPSTGRIYTTFNQTCEQAAEPPAPDGLSAARSCWVCNPTA
jgi:hypothetical protein